MEAGGDLDVAMGTALPMAASDIKPGSIVLQTSSAHAVCAKKKLGKNTFSAKLWQCKVNLESQFLLWSPPARVTAGMKRYRGPTDETMRSFKKSKSGGGSGSDDMPSSQSSQVF